MRKLYIMDVLVRKRLVFLVAAVVVAVACVFMIPHTRINSDMSRYLPDDSRMRQGIDQMTEEFGENGVGSGVVRVMFWSLPDSLRNTTKETLSDIDGVSNILYQNGSQDYNHGDKVLYELLCSSQRSQQDIADEISGQYGSRVVIETSEQGTTAPIGVILIAFSLLLVVLFIMCESWLEPPIFLAAIGVALAVNLGTNALLRSVSATTNSIAGILQLVLSIDYSIILMNRYRQEKALGKGDKVTAMTKALKKASRSIVSSAFTTIVGLLALLFMKFKIGADMGVVLAKGVLCSLLSIFAVLPSLILALDNAIEKSKKRVLRFSTDRLAGFSMKSRIPMALLFVAIFFGSYFLHKKTEISFSLEQKSEISKYFPPKNIIVLLYENSDSSRVIGLADSLAVNPNVKSFVSYPSLMQKRNTASSVKKVIDEFSAMLGNSGYDIADYDMNTVVDAIFYMGSKNPSDERMTLHDFALLAANLSSDTTLLARFGNQFSVNEDGLQSLDALLVLTDTSLINKKMSSEEISEIISVDKELISLICPENQKMSIREIVNTSKELLNESKKVKQVTIKTPEPQPVVDLEEVFLEIDTLEISDVVVQAENTNVSDDEDKIYRDSTIFMKQYSASEIAQLIGMNGTEASIVYTLYGRRVGHKTKTMSVFDFIRFVNNDLANRKLFASRIGEENHKLLKQKEDLMLAALHPVVTEKPEEKPIVVVEEPPAETIVEAADEIITEEQEPNVMQPQNDEENKEYMEKLKKAETIMAIATNGDSLDAAGMKSLLNTLGAEMELRDIELAYLYNGIRHFDDDSVKLSTEEIIGTLHDSIIDNPRFASIVNDEMKCGMDSINAMIVDNLGRLNGRNFSQAIIMTDLPKESDETSEFVETLAAQCDTWLDHSHYLIGESVMMDEMRNCFGNEMLLVTFITILSIFLIVAITFRSLAVPAILVMTVMSAVYISVIVSGLNGHLLYLAYLIMQSILMGATIDYGILFTNNYREARASNCKIESIRRAYMSSTHTIITSGMIMTLAPLAMSVLLDDTAIVMILQCIAAGALAAVLLIIFVLPGLLAALDKFVIKNKHQNTK